MVVNDSNPLDLAVDQISSSQISHKKYVNAVKQISGVVYAALPGEVVCVVGPSRVGKTTAAYKACTGLVPSSKVLRDTDMPIVRVRLRNSTNKGHFDSKLFIRSALAAIEHPVYGAPEPDDPFGFEFDKKMARRSEDVLTSAFARAIKARRTKYLIIDEIQHLHYAFKGTQGALAILDSWKAFAEEEEIVLVTIGTYPILDILNLSPHMLGRMSIIEFQRYKETTDDIEEFQRILNTLDELIPFDSGALSHHNMQLYRGSMGCVGLLLRWIRGSIGLAIAHGHTTLNSAVLSSQRHSDAAMHSIAEEIRKGEVAISGTSDLGTTTSRRNSTTEQPKGKHRKRQSKTKPFQSSPRNYTHGDR